MPHRCHCRFDASDRIVDRCHGFIFSIGDRYGTPGFVISSGRGMPQRIRGGFDTSEARIGEVRNDGRCHWQDASGFGLPVAKVGQCRTHRSRRRREVQRRKHVCLTIRGVVDERSLFVFRIDCCQDIAHLVMGQRADKAERIDGIDFPTG